MMNSIEFMADLDRRFREVSGLSDRRDYSIFYSRLQPARVMVLGIKPGGRRDGTHQLASHGFYEGWEHEYVDMNYPIARVMRAALMKALGASSPDQLRGVPKSNVIFHRAPCVDAFTPAEMRAYAAMEAPFLAEMLAFVRPEAIILEGLEARNLFVRHQCTDVHEDVDRRIEGMRRGRMSRFFVQEEAYVPVLGRRISLLTLGHPSHFGHLPDWRRAVSAMAEMLGPEWLPGAQA